MSEARLFVSHSEGRRFLRISCRRYPPPYSRAPLTRLLRGRPFNFGEDSRCMVPPIINETPYSPPPTRHRNWQDHVDLKIVPFLPPLVPIRIRPAKQVEIEHMLPCPPRSFFIILSDIEHLLPVSLLLCSCSCGP